MTGLDVFAILILLIMAIVVVGIFYFLASWPGRVAHSRNHPHAKAIEIGGWATLVFGAVLWPLVLMWAYKRGGPFGADPSGFSEPHRMNTRSDS